MPPKIKNLKITKPIVILYHANCRDGFGAAWAAWRKFGKRANYIAVEHQMPPPKGLSNKEIYMADFVYPLPVLLKIIRRNKRVTAIDHHVSSEAAAKVTKDYSYAVNHSGAVLAWKYFHPNKPTPRLLRYIEDGDIWNWVVPNSEEILTSLSLETHNFKLWELLARELENASEREKHIKRGKLILRYYNGLLKDFLELAEKVKFVGHTIYAVNAPHNFASDLGHILAQKHPPFAIVWYYDSGKLKVSLRADGGIDVSKIAKKFGGGGHKNASGFSYAGYKGFPWIPHSK